MGTSSSKIMAARSGHNQTILPTAQEIGHNISSDSSLTVREVNAEFALPPMPKKERSQTSPPGASDGNRPSPVKISQDPDSPARPGTLRAKHCSPSQQSSQHGEGGPQGEASPKQGAVYVPLDGSFIPAGPLMPDQWQKGDGIGTGSFGSVFIGLNNTTGELLAVKEVAVNVEAHKMKEAVEQLESEVALLSNLNHPNIVKYVGTLREAKKLYIFLEYVPGGSIAGLLQRFGPLAESVIRVYTRQILKGLAYLHAMRTVHRDIKGANLLVEKNGRIKLADFGMAKQMVEHMSVTRSFKGSAFWMAPEVIRQRGHGVAADIWSVGCTVLEMATGSPPWSQCSTQVQAIFKIASSQELPTIPETLSPKAAEFILLCLQRDPVARPSAAELLMHPFVALREGEVEHPAYIASDEYGYAGVPALLPQSSATSRIPAASPVTAPPKEPSPRLPQTHLSPQRGRLPDLKEDEEGERAAASSRASLGANLAAEPQDHRGEAQSGSDSSSRPGSSGEGSPESHRPRALSDGNVSGIPSASGRERASQGEGGVLVGSPQAARKSLRVPRVRNSSGALERQEENAPLGPSRAPPHKKRSSDGDTRGPASEDATPRTPTVGEDHQSFASQPQQFRVKGLLGLPQLKMHANTGSAHLALPPLEHRPSSGTPTSATAAAAQQQGSTAS